MPKKADTTKRVNVLKQTLRNPDYEVLRAHFTHGAKYSYIQNLYVGSKHRRKGVASKLLREAMKNAKNIGVSEIHVTTRFDNENAIRLYRKLGLVKEHLQLEKEFK